MHPLNKAIRTMQVKLCNTFLKQHGAIKKHDKWDKRNKRETAKGIMPSYAKTIKPFPIHIHTHTHTNIRIQADKEQKLHVRGLPWSSLPTVETDVHYSV